MTVRGAAALLILAGIASPLVGLPSRGPARRARLRLDRQDRGGRVPGTQPNPGQASRGPDMSEESRTMSRLVRTLGLAVAATMALTACAPGTDGRTPPAKRSPSC